MKRICLVAKYGCMVLAVVGCMWGGQVWAASTTLESDGYSVEVKWEADKKTGLLKTRGNVQGGGACDQLRATLYFTNSNKAQTLTVEVDLGMYPADGKPVKFAGETSGVEGKKKDWRAYSVEMNCS